MYKIIWNKVEIIYVIPECWYCFVCNSQLKLSLASILIIFCFMLINNWLFQQSYLNSRILGQVFFFFLTFQDSFWYCILLSTDLFHWKLSISFLLLFVRVEFAGQFTFSSRQKETGVQVRERIYKKGLGSLSNLYRIVFAISMK